MEEFSLFTKIVLETCKEVMTDHDVTLDPGKVKGVFHFMMQEYVLTAEVNTRSGRQITLPS